VSTCHLRWHGHVLHKEAAHWVKKYMEYEVEGSLDQEEDQRGPRERLQKRTVKHLRRML